MSGLVLKNINKTFPGDQQAIRDFNLEVKDREFLILVGPTACGKSTLLRMIGGLEEITSGSLLIDGIDSMWKINVASDDRRTRGDHIRKSDDRRNGYDRRGSEREKCRNAF